MLALYAKAGGVPRYVFRRAERSMVYHKDSEIIIEEAFEHVLFSLKQVKNFDDLILCFIEDAYFIQYSSRLIHQWPDPYYNHYRLQWASRYIYDKIEEKLEKQAWSSLLEQIQKMKEYPSARGIMFEMYVIHLFRFDDDTFHMRQLFERPNNSKNKPKFRKVSMGKPQTTFIRIAEELSTKGDGMIILPETPNFGAADLLYMPDMIFQVTVSKNHPIKQTELVRIVENMPAYKRGKPVNLVFVVPDEIFDDYEYQDIVTKDKESKSFRKVRKLDNRLKNMQQWVLKIDIFLY
ncbi:hypothetical protein C1645_551502 [Glomus cerebriforme]|uniref:Uncharacterized protein n=1 Tax=Glomus cerebriforme TaxID=658196 RepID=A0A397T8L5_9GLOM|nr:hypothetical protein C1645_551502 [Glomus cerebriforme]